MVYAVHNFRFLVHFDDVDPGQVAACSGQIVFFTSFFNPSLHIILSSQPGKIIVFRGDPMIMWRVS